MGGDHVVGFGLGGWFYRRKFGEMRFLAAAAAFRAAASALRRGLACILGTELDLSSSIDSLSYR